MLLEMTLLFFAGLAGGIVNTVAGGGSLITFPALLFAGLPPIIANATNTFAACFGYLSGAYALRAELLQQRGKLFQLILLSLTGGAIGGWLLLQTTDALFRQAIPWLLLFATLLFLYGAPLNRGLSSLAQQYRRASLAGKLLLPTLFLGVSIYGGFFNAGLGIVLLSYFTLAGYRNIHQMNGLKLLASSAISLTAIIVFIFNDAIQWQAGFAVLTGTGVGGYLAGHLSRKVEQQRLRQSITVIAFAITLYYFYEIYGAS